MYYRLKNLRENAEKSQKEIGEVIGTSTAYYGAYEIGKRELPFYRAIELAKYYKVSLDYIAEISDDKGGLHCNYRDPEEKELLQNWKQLSYDERNQIKTLMNVMIKQKKKIADA